MSAFVPATPARRKPRRSDQIRVMVVDDAVVVRGLVSRWIEEAPDLKLVAALRNGREAIEQLDRTKPDVVVLDVEMPELDGISTLPLLLEKTPRSRRHHGFGADPRQRRGHAEGACARRRRLHPEARRPKAA